MSAARFARPEDTAEIVRLAGAMYRSMGRDGSDPRWIARAEDSVRSRLGVDMQAAVVDAPDGVGLVASGAVVLAERLPAPDNMTGMVAYFQWVATDERVRRQGFGTAVMQLLISWCAEQKVPLLELHATPAGESVYQALGFGQEDAVAMRRRIG